MQTIDTTTSNDTSNDTGYIAIPRDLLLEAIAHVEHTRFDYPGHHLGPKLRAQLNTPTPAHATDTHRPATDQRTLADLLRTIPVLVHVGEFPAEGGRLIVQQLLPHVTADQWHELVHTAGMHHGLDNLVIEWPEYNPDLPGQHEHRQAVATDMAAHDLEALIWVLLNPGCVRCVDCVGAAERMSPALPGKTVCGPHLARRGARVGAMRARETGGVR